MDTRFVVFALSMLAMVAGETPEIIEPPEGWSNKLEDMKFCLAKENVTEDEMKDFVIKKINQDDNEPLKMAIYCFLKRINFFDGVSWNLDVITESESKNPKMLQLINDCLENDDFSLSSHERSYRVQKCVLEQGALE